jgi:glycosyltransferase involved in cell wall biosynthesis
VASQDFDGEYEVIVVDDGSGDDTAEIARAARGATVLRQQPRGPAAARNCGVKRSAGDVLTFCDADVYPTPGWLQAGAGALCTADLVQGMVLPDPDATVGPFDRSIWIQDDVGLFETANLFTSRAMFDRVGGFEEWLAPRSGKALAEDVWFGYKALRLGAKSTFCPEALAHHAVFERSWVDYVLERKRLEYFPAMARRIPEMRRRFLYGRLFLTRRSAELDLALAAAGMAWARRSPLWLLATLPYARAARTHGRRSWPAGPRSSVVSLADAAADLAGLSALLAGSVRHRSLVI